MLIIQPGLFISILVGEARGQFLLHTGANCCVLAERMMPPGQLVRPLPPDLKIRGVGGHEINFKGIATVPLLEVHPWVPSQVTMSASRETMVTR